MKVFIGWSGDRSKIIANSLRNWLGDVFPGLSVFMSDIDIKPGERWGPKLNAELEQCNMGILVITPENRDARYLLFEAGALSKAIDESRLIPYLFNLRPVDIVGPLSQFQGVTVDKSGTLEIVKNINDNVDNTRPLESLQRAFEKYWPDLEQQLNSVPTVIERNVKRSDSEMIEEILLLTRNLSNFTTLIDNDGKTQQLPIGIKKTLANLNYNISVLKSKIKFSQDPEEVNKHTDELNRLLELGQKINQENLLF